MFKALKEKLKSLRSKIEKEEEKDSGAGEARERKSQIR